MNMFAGGSPNFNETTGMSPLGAQSSNQNSFMQMLMQMLGNGGNNLGGGGFQPMPPTGYMGQSMGQPRPMPQTSVYAGGNPNFNERGFGAAGGGMSPGLTGGNPGPTQQYQPKPFSMPPSMPGGAPGPTPQYQPKPFGAPPSMPGGQPGPTGNGVSLSRLGLRTAY